MKIAPARISAFEILTKIETAKAFSSNLLPLYEDRLGMKDRALCHELTLGVLRRQMLLDYLIDSLTGGKRIDDEVRIILRIGLYQLRFLDKIPPHAAINDAVNLTQKAKKTSAKGFVNAILRKSVREKNLLNFKDEIEEISVNFSHPRWLIEKWIAQFGKAATRSLVEFNNLLPEKEFRWTAKTTEAVKKSVQEPANKENSAFLRELAANGKIYFQDAGSQIVARTITLNENELFFDVCASPGSKTTQIAAENSLRAKIFAGDYQRTRIKVLQENCHRQGLGNISIVQYDATKSLPFAAEVFDQVLVDAPCSGTGTIRHNPEIRYFLAPTDFEKLPLKQLTILENASKTVKRGGRLIYSTCSLEIEENEGVCLKFIERNPQFSPIGPNVAEKFRTAENFARTFPPTDSMDGFFIAEFAKK